VVGAGRAGSALALALRAAGLAVEGPLGRGDVAGAAAGVDLLVLAVPDATIASVAAAVDPVPGTVVAHLAGSLGLDVLAPHARRAAIHPLVALPSADVGAARLGAGAWFALAAEGDPLAETVVAALGGRAFTVADRDRARYHAAAVIASNHLVALLDQAAAVAPAGVPLAAYLDLVRATVENVAALGPRAALTGPAARGDAATIARHLAAIPEDERPLYEVLSERCRRMAAP
jgi:predicted short-subunit dehydrogenase-like oxidoreductase (DUF2520 family)